MRGSSPAHRAASGTGRGRKISAKIRLRWSAHVMGRRADDAIVRALLHDVCHPAEHTRSGECRRKQLLWNAEREAYHTLVELEIRAQSTALRARLRNECRIHGAQRIEYASQRWLGRNLLRHVLDHPGTRIDHTIFPMAHPHYDAPICKTHRDELARALRRS